MPRYGKSAQKSVKSAMHRKKKGTLSSGKGRQRWKGQDQKASHRHRPFGSSQEGRQGAQKEVEQELAKGLCCNGKAATREVSPAQL